MNRKSWSLIACLLVIILIALVFSNVFRGNNQPEIKVKPTVVDGPKQSTDAAKETAVRDVYKYIEPEIAGGGSYNEEMQRYTVYLSRQGVICRNIRHFGGAINKDKGPPEYDPDGAWYLCLDPEVELTPKKCVVYSIGIDNEWSFDDRIAQYGCKVYAFDPTINKGDHDRSPSIKFFNTGLSDTDSAGTPGGSGRAAWKTRKLATIIKELGHENRMIDVLKVDIESDEWKCLPQMLADGSMRKYVRQFDVEFHVVAGTPNGIRRYYGIGQWLDRQGFKIANMHKNMFCPQCYEVTFINTNLVKLPIH